MWEAITGPWPWYVAGPSIALVAVLLLLNKKSFGISATLRTVLAAGGAGQNCQFFRYNWRNDFWNLTFVVGIIIGGWLASTYLTSYEQIAISQNTVAELKAMGVDDFKGFLPRDLFGKGQLADPRTLALLIGGGFLVGFGTRYAGGCTSGHAISGLANLQVPSLIAVIGFFIGGLTMAWFILPHLLQ